MFDNISHQKLQDKLQSLANEFQAYKRKNEAWKEAKKRIYSLSNRTQDGISVILLKPLYPTSIFPFGILSFLPKREIFPNL
jgi:succinate dehydrogenase/fumarate reductase flavoprotein subunit